MQRAQIEVVRRRHLNQVPEVHDGNAVRDVPHHRQVVSDHDVRQPELVLKVFEQVHHLRLDRDVQRRHRLVGDDHLRAQHNCAGDTDSLALPAGELVRIAVVVLGVEPDPLHDVLHRSLDPARRLHALDLVRRADDGADGVPRVQRVVRVLKDHLHLTAQRHHLLAREPGDVAALQLDAATGRLEQLEHRATGGRLAATALADQPQRLALAHLERNPVHRLDVADVAAQQALGDREVFLQVGDLQDGLAHASSINGAVTVATFSRSVPSRSRSFADRWHLIQWPSATSSSAGRSVSQRLLSTCWWY